MMKLYLAPMEEVTGYVFRNTIEECYGGVDKYFTPFVSPNQNKILKTKDGRELLPGHNKGKNVVPQLLSSESYYSLKLIDLLYSLGYREVNLNFGCPSATVVKKKRGSGILKDLDLLDSFLDQLFNGISKYGDLKISVKTRIGLDDPDKWPEILNIYNSYPLSELIIHARLQKDFYKGSPDLQAFDYAVENANMPLCYNGNIFSTEDYGEIITRYPQINSVMIGRGAVAHPDIFAKIKNSEKESRVSLREFHDRLCALYFQEFGGNDGVCKMKEFWTYYKDNFIMGEKNIRGLMKTKTPAEYKAAVYEIFYKG